MEQKNSAVKSSKQSSVLQQTERNHLTWQKHENLQSDESLSISQEPIKRHTYASLFLAVLSQTLLHKAATRGPIGELSAVIK